jgi:protein-S-isoprenylcysteine O-methyltransferase Ste14
MARLGRLGSRATDAVTRAALVGIAQLLVVFAIVLFAGAGSLDFWEAWAFCAVFGISVTAITVHFLRHDPKLIEARLRAGPGAETRTSQRVIQGFASLFFLALLLVPALDRRFHWSEVPAYFVVAADVLVALGLLIVFLVFRENSYASATIEVQQEQRVVSTGPYRVVRHPMYSGALLLLLAMPVALGSFVGLVFVPPLVAVIVLRLLDEERYLGKSLPGYEDYRRKTRHCLVPLVW